MLALGLAIVAPGVRAVESADAAASQSMHQFLARESPNHAYRALRRLEAENRGRTAWLEAWTTFTPGEAFEYLIVSEGGSPYIRSRVLRAVLEGEKEVIDRGETERSALATSNYRFESDGLDPAGLVRVALVPRRNEGVLVAGSMFLKPVDGEFVRIEGRLARNPSFWVKQVDIVRSYARIAGAVLPVDPRDPGAAPNARAGDLPHDLRIRRDRRRASQTGRVIHLWHSAFRRKLFRLPAFARSASARPPSLAEAKPEATHSSK